MRFYLKVLTAVALFAIALASPLRQTIGDLAYEARVAYVWHYGSPGDFEKLLDDTQKSLAEERGDTESYDFGKRYHRLVAERLAEVQENGSRVSEDDRQKIEAECAQEALRFTRWAPKQRKAEQPPPQHPADPLNPRNPN